jgi:hypothetical protein
MTLVIDGYSAPVTGGNFVRNVLEGVYCGLPLSANGSSVTAGRGALPGEASSFGLCNRIVWLFKDG